MARWRVIAAQAILELRIMNREFKALNENLRGICSHLDDISRMIGPDDPDDVTLVDALVIANNYLHDMAEREVDIHVDVDMPDVADELWRARTLGGLHNRYKDGAIVRSNET